MTYLERVPFCFTATATMMLLIDIQQKLGFKEQNLFQQSFERKNLTYVAIKEENKLNRLLKVVTNLKGSGIVYMRSRKKTVELAEFLKKNNISSTFYHAGLRQEKPRYQTEFMGIRRNTGDCCHQCFWDGNRQTQCPVCGPPGYS